MYPSENCSVEAPEVVANKSNFSFVFLLLFSPFFVNLISLPLVVLEASKM